jgi:hypothetical protein
MHHDISGAHRMLHLVLDNPGYALLIIGMIGGWIVWAAHKIFVTHHGMYECKTEIIRSLEIHKEFDDNRINNFMDRNDKKHNDLEKKIDRLIEFIMKRH